MSSDEIKKDVLETQVVQESQYEFPYHYIPTNNENQFRLFLYWSWGLNYISSNEYIIRLLETIDFESLIDIGCGDGRLLRDINRQFPSKQLIGIDYSERAIGVAKALNPNISYRNINILEELPEFQYDVVTLVEVLEHIPINQAKHFMASVASTHKTGGKLILTVPHDNVGVQKKHFQHFNSETIKPYLGNEYKIEQFFYFDKKSRIVRYLQFLLKNRFFILNYQPALNGIYRLYLKHFFHCSEENCRRIGLIATRT